MNQTLIAALALGLLLAGGALFLMNNPTMPTAPDTAALEAQANEHVQAGRWAEAATAFEMIVEANPRHGQAWFQLAAARRQLEAWSGSAAAYERAYDLGANPVAAAFNLARVHGQNGDLDAGFRWLGVALDAGLSQVALLDGDAQLAPLRDDARFETARAHAQRNATPCEHDPRFRQFDFWLGSWDVFDAQGNLQGTNRIEKHAGGCLLIENWVGAGGSTGNSLNYFDPHSGEWVQNWVDGSGGSILQRGRFEDGAMRLAGTHYYGDGQRLELYRGSWTPLPDGRVRQHLEQSADGGKSWYVWFDGYYTRQDGAE